MRKKFEVIERKVEDKGSIYGYVVDTEADNLSNWLEDRNFSKGSLQTIRSKYSRVAILLSIQVDEGFRNQGIGSELLNHFIYDAFNIYGADVIILEADTEESNNISIVDWYEGHSFDILERNRNYYPLMLCEAS